MSILIKGMEMPKPGRYFVAVDNADGKDKTVISVMSEFERGDKTRPLLAVHEIIPVPPHGRLIDTDAVSLEDGPYEYDEWCKWALDQYQDAPTIIPAEESKE